MTTVRTAAVTYTERSCALTLSYESPRRSSSALPNRKSDRKSREAIQLQAATSGSRPAAPPLPKKSEVTRAW